MDIKYEISNERVRFFTESAKNRLQEQSRKYTLELISEAERIEGLTREKGVITEITDNIVLQAVRRTKTRTKKNFMIIILKIISDIFLFLSGLLFIPEKFISTDNTLDLIYFIFFLVIIVIAILATVLTYFIDGE